MAERRARASAAEARDERQGVDSMEKSMQRMADAMTSEQRMVAGLIASLVREGGYETRGGGVAGRIQAHMSTSRWPPRPDFTLEYVGGHAYRLRNVGMGQATGVTISPDKLPLVANRLPNDVTLGPGQSTGQFVLRGAAGALLPGEIVVTCNELADPVTVPIP